jgi:hypothetical protein
MGMKIRVNFASFAASRSLELMQAIQSPTPSLVMGIAIKLRDCRAD